MNDGCGTRQKRLVHDMPEMDKLPAPPVRRRKGQHLTVEERKQIQETFLKALANTANVRAACLQANISHTTIYQWQETDEEFALRFKEANTEANWLLFGEAWRRAMSGDERYVTSHGRVVIGPDGKPLTYRERSDRLLELLMRARLPEFRDTKNTTIVNVLPKEYVNFVPADDGVEP